MNILRKVSLTPHVNSLNPVVRHYLIVLIQYCLKSCVIIIISCRESVILVYRSILGLTIPHPKLLTIARPAGLW